MDRDGKIAAAEASAIKNLVTMLPVVCSESYSPAVRVAYSYNLARGLTTKLPKKISNLRASLETHIASLPLEEREEAEDAAAEAVAAAEEEAAEEALRTSLGAIWPPAKPHLPAEPSASKASKSKKKRPKVRNRPLEWSLTVHVCGHQVT